jgi:hypothetical protein
LLKNEFFSNLLDGKPARAAIRLEGEQMVIDFR